MDLRNRHYEAASLGATRLNNRLKMVRGLGRRRSRPIHGLLVLAVVVAAISLVARSSRANTDGLLDTTFGSNGSATTEFSGDTDVINGIVLQSDGKIIAAGRSNSGGGSTFVDFALARYHSNGTLDTSFGNAGKVTTDMRGDASLDEAFGLALQPDGKMVLVGSSAFLNIVGVPTRSNIALARYNADGSLDGTFGTGGRVLTDLGSTSDAAAALVLRSDGDLVVLAATRVPGNPEVNTDFALVRYNADGSLDESFGTAGRVITDFSEPFDMRSDSPTALLTQPDGRYLAVGYSRAVGSSLSDYGLSLARYNADGSLDDTFGNGGKVRTSGPAGRDILATTMALYADGNIVIGGSAGLSEDFALLRYRTDGSLDPTFGLAGGIVTRDFGGSLEQVNKVIVQADSRLLATGLIAGTPAVARYNLDGTVDTTFGTDGHVLTSFEGAGAGSFLAGVITPGGRLVTAGYAGGTRSYDFALARYNLGPGALPLPLNYVALGDSYSSGEGAVDSGDIGNWYIDSNLENNRCHRNGEAYPVRLSRLMGLDLGPQTTSDISPRNFVACSGARIEHVSRISQYPGEPEGQLSRVSATTQLVTITIGGNDLSVWDPEYLGAVRYTGLGEILRECAKLGEPHCSDRLTSNNILELKAPLRDIYKSIANTAPTASVIVLTYPQIFAPEPSGCFSNTFLSNNEITWLRQLVKNLNEQIRIAVVEAAATVPRVVIAEQESAFTDHWTCSPVPFANDLVTLGLEEVSPSSFHPNTSGQFRMAQLVAPFRTTPSFTTTTSTSTSTTTTTTLPPAHAPIGDFDGDGDSDISNFRPSSAQWFVHGGMTTSFGLPGDLPVPCDYDGDGDADVGVFRPSVGGWYVQGQPPTYFGLDGDVPIPADYDGDGDCDLAVFRPSVGGWYRIDAPTTYFGLDGDIAVPGDYDGNGAADIAIFRPSVGGWYRQGAAPTFFGLSGDIPVPGDYDGNGSVDISIVRPSVGGWYSPSRPTSFLGLGGDIPAPGDYDGNSTTDLAVFRPSTGQWFIQGQTEVFFGASGDLPLPLPTAIRIACFS